MRTLCAISLVLALVTHLPGQIQQPAEAADAKVETIVFIRHAEKPEAGLGQLDCRGLNRAHGTASRPTTARAECCTSPSRFFRGWNGSRLRESKPDVPIILIKRRARGIGTK